MTDLVGSAAGLPGFEDLLAGDQIAGTREYQEDDFRIIGFPDGDPDGCDLLLVLADGMGGRPGGGRASRLAVSAFVDTFRRATGGVDDRLCTSLDAADIAVGRAAAEDRRYAGMGCTLVGCVVTDGGAAYWISVGDSPLWRLGGGAAGETGEMERLNEDHSMRPVLENLVRLGRMRPEEAQGRAAHKLRSALTGKSLALVDEGAPPVRLRIGDCIVVASDGLQTLAEEEIRRLCSGQRTSAAMVSDLLEAVEAAKRPSQDNATVLVYRHLAAAGVRRRFERLAASMGSAGGPGRCNTREQDGLFGRALGEAVRG